jgi:hypothetical protein
VCLGGGIFEPRMVMVQVGSGHVFQCSSELTDARDRTRPPVVKTFNDAHDCLLGNILVFAIVILLAVQLVFIRRFLGMRQANRNHEAGLAHSIFSILRIVGREIAHQGKPTDNGLFQPQASVHSLQ